MARCIVCGIRREYRERGLITGVLAAPFLAASDQATGQVRSGSVSDDSDERGQRPAVDHVFHVIGQQDEIEMHRYGATSAGVGDSVRPTEDVLRAQFSRDVLALLTEWGQTALVRQMLNDLSAELGEPVSTDLLNAMLHEALVHDQRSIAALGGSEHGVVQPGYEATWSPQ